MVGEVRDKVVGIGKKIDELGFAPQCLAWLWKGGFVPQASFIRVVPSSWLFPFLCCRQACPEVSYASDQRQHGSARRSSRAESLGSGRPIAVSLHFIVSQDHKEVQPFEAVTKLILYQKYVLLPRYIILEPVHTESDGILARSYPC